MKKLTKEEREHIYKMNETVLYDIGYEHVNNVCEETDRLLEEYKDIKVLESLDEWFKGYLNKYDKKTRRNKIKRISLQIGKRVAMVLVALTIITATLTVSVEAFRIRLFNMIIEINKEFSTTTFDENHSVDYLNELPEEWSDFYYPTFLPEDYQFANAFDTNGTKYILFNNSKMEELYFVQGLIVADFQLNSENSNVVEVDINGMEGIIIIKDKSNIINWHNNNQSFYIQGNVDKSTLLEIVESILKK